MRDFRDAKAMATSLRQALSDKSVTLTHSESLELIAKTFGLDNWNILAAKIEAETPTAARPEPTAPEKGKTIYCSFCGKSQTEVRTIIAGPDAFICNECVGLCDGIMLEKDVLGRLSAAQAKRPDAEPLDAAREAFATYSDERLQLCSKSFVDNLEHTEWALRQTLAALEREPGTPWRPDERAVQRGWRRDPMADKSREEILAHKAILEGRAADSRRGAELIARILSERGVGQGPNTFA